MRNLAHGITIARGVSGFGIAWLLLVQHQHMPAFWLFVVAMLTDLIDGWFARRFGADRAWGELLDPLADKVLINLTWLTLAFIGWAPWWLVTPLMLRDAIVASIWRISRSHGVTWPPSIWGQLATSYEGTSVGILLFHGPFLGVHWPSVGVAVGVMGLILSLVSAVGYAVRGPVQAA